MSFKSVFVPSFDSRVATGLWLLIWIAFGVSFAIHLSFVDGTLRAIFFLAWMLVFLRRLLSEPGHGDRIVVTDSGISYERGSSIFFWKRSWSCDWSRVKVRKVRDVLVLTVCDNKHGLDPSDWKEQGERLEWRRWLGLADRSESSLLLVIARHAIIEIVSEPEFAFPVKTNEQPAGVRFWVSVAVSLVILSAGFEAWQEGHEAYVQRPSVFLFISAGAFVGAVLAVWMLYGRCGRSVALSAFIIGTLCTALAAYPLALRLNDLTDGAGLQRHEYVVATGGKLTPRDPGLPVIVAARTWEGRYWEAQPAGSVHQIEIRRGGLGFWQYVRPEKMPHQR